MKDSLCLIDVKHIINNKSYSNMGEFCLRNPGVYEYLSISSSDGRVCTGNCSDLDLLREFLKCIVANSDSESRVAKGFFRVIEKITQISSRDILEGKISADELWNMGYNALSKGENSLWGIIGRSDAEALGVAVYQDDVVLPAYIGNTEIMPVVCPIPKWTELCGEIGGLSDIEVNIRRMCDDKKSGAVILSDLEFEFEVPNPYVASTALDKMKKGITLKDSERRILKSQLLRIAVSAFADSDGELMLFLPSTSKIDILYHTDQFLEYIDKSNVGAVKLVLFASDCVGCNFAISEQTKGRKKITVEAAICGNDCCIPSDDEMKYWSGQVPRLKATLAKTAAGLL